MGADNGPNQREAMRVNRQQVAEKVKAVITDTFPMLEEAKVTELAELDNDLGLDSLDQVELVMALEEAFEVEIPDEDMDKFSTVAGLIHYLHQKAA